jgi:uncharacterized RDD family membrane protein YckC
VHLECPRCGRVLEFSGERPSFCAYCGQALADTTPPARTDLLHEAATEAAAEAAPAAAAPQAVGGYRLLRLLGSGGMGEVYEAQDSASGRRVALKLVSAEYAASADTVQRFRQEGRLASAIAHPRCVFVLAADEDAGRPYIVMELMPGATLDDLIQRQGPLSPEQAVAKILDVIEGLQEAHRLGVIHRDVKPSNCFLEPDGRVKVGDFGLAKSLVEDVRLTRTGAFLGTPLFASPEQIRREPLDAQTDVYSVSATLYFLLTGRAPFQGGDAASCIARIVSDEPPPMRSLRPEIPAALDRAVLHGLERNRKQRWQDLEELRTALLPFVPGRITAAAMGNRFAAYLLDYVIVSLLVSVIVLPGEAVMSAGGTTGLATESDLRAALSRVPAGFALLTSLIPLCLNVVYFGVLEGFWGWSLGKKLLGLRVCTAHYMGTPGLARATLRALVFAPLRGLGDYVFLLGLYFFPVPSVTEPLFFLIAPLNVLGLCLLLGTMRARNGYRGLHEFASGTRVVQVPRAAMRWTVRPRPLDLDEESAHGMPARVGSFAVRGVVARAAQSQILLGHDPGLGRDVLIWLRPPGRPLAAARREVNRPTRLRWVAGGRHDGADWDAFLAPTGRPLPDAVAESGPPTWSRVRPLLELLTEELVAADGDGTLPATMAVGQVWVQPDGGVRLLDHPLLESDRDAGGKPPADTECAPPPAPAGETEQRRALTFLGGVALLALEGRPRPPSDPWAPLCVPLPRHAAWILNRLLSFKPLYRRLRRFQADLRATRDWPTEVTRTRRATQVAILTTFLLLPSLVVGGVALLASVVDSPPLASYFQTAQRIGRAKNASRELTTGSAREFAATVINPDPWVRLAGACRCAADQRLLERLRLRLAQDQQEQEARARNLRSPASWFIGLAGRQLESATGTDPGRGARLRVVTAAGPAEFRQAADRAALAPDDSVVEGATLPPSVLITFAAWLSVWVVAAFLARGGVTFALTGIRLVYSDGRRASRLRCAWRALLAWAPVAGLILLAVWLDVWHLSHWREGPAVWVSWLAVVAWWLVLGVLVLYLVLALRSPDRGWHDRLAGTWLVPR